MTRKPKSALVLATIVLGASLLSGCVGFDPGLAKRCAFTWKQGDPKSHVDQTDCPGDPTAIYNSGQMWAFGSNAPKPDGSHCGDPGLAYKLDDFPWDTNSPLKVRWPQYNTPRGARAYNPWMGIAGNPCADDTEITHAMFNGTGVPIQGLRTTNQIRLTERAGINHVGVAAYVRDPVTGDTWTLDVVFRPTSTDDPRWNHPAPGVFFRGTSERAGSHLILLDAHHFGIPNLCPPNQPCDTRVDIDWDTLFNFIESKNGWWEGLWPVKSRVYASIALQLQTFDLGSRIWIVHQQWAMGLKNGATAAGPSIASLQPNDPPVPASTGVATEGPD